MSELLEQEGSPIASAMLAVETYAGRRAQREGLSEQARKALVQRGYQTIMERGVNGLYQVLASLPPEMAHVRTPTLDAMSQDVETLMATHAQQIKTRAGGVSAEDDLVRFSLRLRSYGTRLREHNAQREMWRQRASEWESGFQAGVVSSTSEAMRRLYLEEEEYHARCVSKYRSLLGPLATGVDGESSDETWKEALSAVDQARTGVFGLEGLLGDRSIPKMKDANEAERLGVVSHGVSGGRLLVAGGSAGRQTLRRRLEKARETLKTRMNDLVSTLSGKGLVLKSVSDESVHESEQTEGTLTVVSGERWTLSETKGMDLHDVRSDTVVDMALGRHTAQGFVQWARRRQRLVDEARTYLEQSGQSTIVDAVLPLGDVRRMSKVADDLEKQMSAQSGDLVLTSALSDVVPMKKRVRRSATVSFDEGLAGIVRDSTWRETADLVPQIETVLDTPENDIMDASDDIELG